MDRRKLIMRFLPDVIVPALIYFLLRALRLEPAPALLVAAAYSGGRVGFVAVVHRRPNVIGGLVGVGVLIGGLLTLITGESRFLIARESVVSGILGLILLVSWAIRRPVIYSLIKMMNRDDRETADRLDQLWQHDPGFRHAMMIITAVWGAAAVAESAIRIVLVFVLALDLMAAVSVALQVGTAVALVGWTIWYRKLRRHPVGARNQNDDHDRTVHGVGA